MKEVAKATDDHMANLIILYFRAVDKLLYSFSSKEDLYKVGHEINKIMVQHNLPLQIPFSTSQAHHYNFFLDHSEETVLGYRWIKSEDLIIPDIPWQIRDREKGDNPPAETLFS